MKKSNRPAISALDLLVVLAIIGILIGLLLPAIVKVRGAAKRTTSMNNLHQLAIAAHNYHSANGHFPPGNDANNFSTTAPLLPYLEEDELYKKIDFKKSVTDKANAEARKVTVKLLLSPLDPIFSVSEEYGATNYLFKIGRASCRERV